MPRFFQTLWEEETQLGQDMERWLQELRGAHCRARQISGPPFLSRTGTWRSSWPSFFLS